jgi:hypothetical protein
LRICHRNNEPGVARATRLAQELSSEQTNFIFLARKIRSGILQICFEAALLEKGSFAASVVPANNFVVQVIPFAGSLELFSQLLELHFARLHSRFLRSSDFRWSGSRSVLRNACRFFGVPALMLIFDPGHQNTFSMTRSSFARSAPAAAVITGCSLRPTNALREQAQIAKTAGDRHKSQVPEFHSVHIHSPSLFLTSFWHVALPAGTRERSPASSAAFVRTQSTRPQNAPAVPISGIPKNATMGHSYIG